MKKISFLILGAGPTGIGAAFRLKELGERSFAVIEKENQAGGLSRSFQDDKGFWWDIGGHVQFSHYPYFDRMMDAALPSGEWNRLERESWIWMRERFIPYPLQNNIHRLPKEEFWKCLTGLIDAETAPQSNLKLWLLTTFGQGLCDSFLFPYNFKVWAHPLDMLSHQWIGERVAVVELKRILNNYVFDKDDKNWGPNNQFKFPKRGGTGAIWRSLAQKIGHEHFNFNSSIKSVHLSKREVTLHNGEQYHYDHCLSTLPIDRLCELSIDLSMDIKTASKQLCKSTTNVYGIGIEDSLPEHLNRKCWMYFPESHSPYYRITVFSHYGENVPDPKRQYSLMCEVSESRYKTVNRNELYNTIRQALVKDGLLREKGKVVSEWSIRMPYGYPVPTVNRDEILSFVHPHLELHQMYSRGRFGGWKYEVSNQDHSSMQGVEWVDKIVKSQAEKTYRWEEILKRKAG